MLKYSYNYDEAYECVGMITYSDELGFIGISYSYEKNRFYLNYCYKKSSVKIDENIFIPTCLNNLIKLIDIKKFNKLVLDEYKRMELLDLDYNMTSNLIPFGLPFELKKIKLSEEQIDGLLDEYEEENKEFLIEYKYV